MALSGVDVPKMQWIGDNLQENWRRFKQHAEFDLVLFNETFVGD